MDYLDPVTRRRIQEARLEREEERRKARREEQIKHEWLTRLAPLMQSVVDLTGGAALVVEDQAPVRRWLADNFPFSEDKPLPAWERVPGATGREVSFANHRALRWTIQQLAAHVGAQSGDRLIIIWRDPNAPALSMSLASCIGAIGLLAGVPGGEMLVASQSGGWLMEFNPYLNECHAARADGTTGQPEE